MSNNASAVAEMEEDPAPWAGVILFSVAGGLLLVALVVLLGVWLWCRRLERREARARAGWFGRVGAGAVAVGLAGGAAVGVGGRGWGVVRGGGAGGAAVASGAVGPDDVELQDVGGLLSRP